MRTPTASLNPVDSDGEAHVGVRDGWKAIQGRPALVGYLGVQALASATFAMFPVLFIAFVIDVLDGNEATVGIIRGMAAFGGLAASIIVGRVARKVAATTLMAWGYAGLGAIAFLFVNIASITTALWVFLIIFGVSGLPNMTSQVGAIGAAQRLCPPELYGRFQGVASATGAVGAIVGSVLVGLLVDRTGVTILLNVQATLYVFCGIASYAFIVRRTPVDAPPVSE